jgi:putative transposase
MSRPLRIEYAEAVYHVTFRGNGRRPIFKDDKDRGMLLNILEEVNDRYHWLCHAYCLMNNHYHLVIETPDGNLSKGMRQLNGVYTMRLIDVQFGSKRRTVEKRYRAFVMEGIGGRTIWDDVKGQSILGDGDFVG